MLSASGITASSPKFVSVWVVYRIGRTTSNQAIEAICLSEETAKIVLRANNSQNRGPFNYYIQQMEARP